MWNVCETSAIQPRDAAAATVTLVECLCEWIAFIVIPTMNGKTSAARMRRMEKHERFFLSFSRRLLFSFENVGSSEFEGLVMIKRKSVCV